MTEVEVISFIPNSPDPLFRVVYSPRGKSRRKELAVVGTVLTKIQALDCFSPVTSYRLEPAFIYKGEIVLGESYWDRQRDGGS